MSAQRRTHSILLTALGLALGACDDGAGRGRELGLGPADDVREVVEGDYGPIAQYLVDNANTPVPSGQGESGGSDGGVDPSAGGSGSDGGGDPSGGLGCSGFSCNDGQCIDASWRCDAITDCSGGEDEANCGNDGGNGSGGGGDCSGFACNDGSCIDASWQCDGYSDCSGGEDESGCGGSGGDPSGGDPSGGDPSGGDSCDGFRCDDGLCVEWSWVCDGYADCAVSEDESGCSVDADASLGLTQPPRVQEGPALDCIAKWTVGGGAAGAAAGEAISKACEGGGVVVGLATGGGGFAAATVCFAGDVTQIDAVVGGIFGAVAGLVGGIASCEGDALAEAGSALQAVLSVGSIPTYKVEASGTTETKRCGIPVDVPLSGDQADCDQRHSTMKQFEQNEPHSCDIDIGNVGNDAASIAAACSEIRKNFDNAAKLADLRLDVGRACYENGDKGPMGNSDFGHQFAWCSVHKAMQRCVTQANHAKLKCDLTQTMAQHFLPAGCENVLACQ
ncbi:MAG: hypothetical protein IPH07_33255 [Deltaproteobacteria bacterium]|nr:hypothetical protein [Deltaproteobacteria bacterium]MBK8235050.1 hypothetical protein [Deltaproteobacteria bacterium]MBP7290185.1 hypothetical protein [Nannocystaceae bacterium]